MSDIANWLRFISDDDGMAPCKEAADEIERLRAENAAAERLTLHHIELREAQRRRAERAEAQVAALREALEQAEACMSIVEPRSDKREYLRVLGEIRAALEDKG